MPPPAAPLTRADLPATFTPETVRRLPLATLRQLADPHNGILDPAEQQAFDGAVNDVMRRTAERLSDRLGGIDWAAVRHVAARIAQSSGRPPDRTDERLRRMVRRIGEQVDLAQALAPGVDWSFARSAHGKAAPTSTDPAQDHGTVSDLEHRLTDQVEMVSIMNDLDDAGRRTLALEQERDRQSTRSVFFGFVVSVAVLVAGWAPLVAADDWAQRLWIAGLTLGTCALAGAVYGLVRMRQNRQAAADTP